MNNLIKAFHYQFNDLQDKLEKTKSVVVITLGPDGTSSNEAAKYLVNYFEEVNPQCQYKIILKDNFDDVFETLKENASYFALIPTAYERITNFFWYHKFSNACNFLYPTPMYGLIARKGFNSEESNNIRVASCYAVENIIEYLGEDLMKEKEIIKVRTASTIEAAKFVVEGKADIAITNQSSYDIYKDEGIEFVSSKYNAEIVWSLFINNYDIGVEDVCI